MTGSEDSSVRLWDLRRVDTDGSDGWGDEGEMVNLSDVAEEDESESEGVNVIRNGKEKQKEDVACLRVLEGHTKAVTTLFFEDDCLVRPSFLDSTSALIPLRSLVRQIKH